MAFFSVNQNRQFYVATKLATATPATKGEIKLGNDADKSHMYFQYMGVDGLERTDLIDVNKVMYAKFTKAADMAKKLKTATVTLKGDINGGAPISGQDYILNINIQGYVGKSDANQLTKFGAVHAFKSTDASTFYKEMAISLANNFSREIVPLFKFYIKTAKSQVEVKAGTKVEALTDAATGLIIEEAVQPWKLGSAAFTGVLFDVYPTTVQYEGDEVQWGEVVKGESATTIGNGKKIAELEYFCMGERGDQYRGVEGPKYAIPVEYSVDPSKTYNLLDIHYYFLGSGIDAVKSEKDLTIAFESSVNVATLVTALGDLGITVTDPNA